MTQHTKISWKSILPSDLTFSAKYKVLPTKGNMAWEYNPFRNYRLSQDMYEYNEKLYTKKDLCKELEIKVSDFDSVETLDQLNLFTKEKVQVSLYQKGELVDFITDELSFDINHPVNILPAYSYDGSVDLILNDGVNQPRLINSRFSATGSDTYEVIDRKGDNDTNIYDLGALFDVDTALYKKTNRIATIVYNGDSSGGNLKIGNYHFYFKYTDADGNETDFIGESGLVSVFKGSSTPQAMSTGQRDENSLKKVSFTISNIDDGYQYLNVYYTRATAEINLNMLVKAVKIELKYLVSSNGKCNVIVTGDEETTEIPISDINLLFNVISAAKTLCTVQNMLFLGNVQKAEIPYDELQDLSLRFCPYLKNMDYPLKMDENYNITSTSKGYFDSKFIYDFTGYWKGDLYRLGIVYIMKDNTLSPVFNIRGRENVCSFGTSNIVVVNDEPRAYDLQYTYIPVRDAQGERIKINYNEASNYIVKDAAISELDKGNANYENVKGVVSLHTNKDTDVIHGFLIVAEPLVLDELSKYVKGFFFVRLKRMPLTLCLGIAIGVENKSNIPMIPTADGIIDFPYDYTYVEANNDPSAVHYITEGFMSRYKFRLKPKSLGFWSKVLKAVAISALIVGVSTFLPGIGTYIGMVAGKLMGAALVTSIAGSIGLAGLGGVVIAGAATAAGLAAGVVSAVVAGIQETVNAVRLAHNANKAKNPFRGRNEPIPKGYKRVEDDDSRKLDADYQDRIIVTDYKNCKVGALIVPDYTVNPALYNLLFTGETFTVETVASLPNTNYKNEGYFLNDNGRHFYTINYVDRDEFKAYKVKLLAIADGLAYGGIDTTGFRARAGDPELAYRFRQIAHKYKDNTLNSYSDMVRGNFGPYVAMTNFHDTASSLVNIKIPNYSKGQLDNYIQIRMNDHSEFCAISDRIDINTAGVTSDHIGNTKRESFSLDVYRGDCYICQFTLRIIRNFNDANAPYNETIVDPKNWRENYDYDDSGKLGKLNVGDVNAVELGLWLTFRLRSTYNLNIRTIDDSYVDEKAECGHARAYFPYEPMSTDGSYKIPEALCYNLGFSKSLSERYNFEVPDVPYIKNWFGTRIMYSDINITDGYKNGFRTFRGTTYRDYTREYGEIVKLVPLNSNILVVFEHGIGLLGVNEKAVAALGATGLAYITTNNVLPETPLIISDTFGSQWTDSIIKVPVTGGSTTSVVYGVDTVAKKIWKTNGLTVECISDFKVLEFLNNNITLGERDKLPILGIRNVKSFYNAFKLDVMFTFYDCLNGFEDKVWNLCWNQLLGQFTTFYSWVPSHMENIYNIPFSFDRDVTKNIVKLGISKENNDFSGAITLSNNILYLHTDKAISNDPTLIGILNISKDKLLPVGTKVEVFADFSVEPDQQGNHNYFEVKETTIIEDGKEKKVQGLYYKLKPEFLETYEDSNMDGIINEFDSELYANRSQIYVKTMKDAKDPNKYFKASDFYSELYYRNTLGNEYSDWKANMSEWPCRTDSQYYDANGLFLEEKYNEVCLNKLLSNMEKDLPIFKNRQGKMITLAPEEQLNPDKIIRLLNIKATIYMKYLDEGKATRLEIFKSTTDDKEVLIKNDSRWMSCGSYETTVAVIPDWNLQFLRTDFWRHGQAGLIDIADEIKPTMWYGKLHPFEFECVVVNDPSTHKVFRNLELIANKAEPESFHFEIVGEAYDFAKDKPNMYWRQEARKALFQYNGANISYNPNFLKISPHLNPKSAELLYLYYERRDTLHEILDTYITNILDKFFDSPAYEYWLLSTNNTKKNKDYRHLSGAELVYYPNRQEFRIWQHLPAINIDKLSQDTATSLIKGNCMYLEDRWKISINPLLVTYKNEYSMKNNNSHILIRPDNSDWAYASDGVTRIPPITVYNAISIPSVLMGKSIEFPEYSEGIFPDAQHKIGKSNALYGLYGTKKVIVDYLKDAYGNYERDTNGNYVPIYNDYEKVDYNAAIDPTNWIHLGYRASAYGEISSSRLETDLRDKFIKIRIRYSGKELAVIDWLNTIYQISYA